jgi:hypothetical protein
MCRILFGIVYLGFCCVVLGCTKLQEKNVKFDVNCPDCIKIVIDSVSAMRGLHYIAYNEADNNLTIKFDTANFSVRRFNYFLTENGYVKISQDSVKRKPNCCK